MTPDAPWYKQLGFRGVFKHLATGMVFEGEVTGHGRNSRGVDTVQFHNQTLTYQEQCAYYQCKAQAAQQTWETGRPTNSAYRGIDVPSVNGDVRHIELIKEIDEWSDTLW